VNYRVQVSAFNSEGGYTPLDPQETQANTPLQAAQNICGADLVHHGPHERLAATVREKGTGNPYPMRFCRAQ
jgi:hypothetical protein